jgi:imidazolonepropionase-like amidohydrolase
MRAGIAEAHKAGRKVATHAYSAEAINNALDAGVDSIEHGSFIDRATAERMREQGTYLVPTMSAYEATNEKGPNSALRSTSKARPPRYWKRAAGRSGSRWGPVCS